ncbi:MAG: lipid-A-disaccharide synthase [Burkholderiaceae bacterium]|jgi:lipid-A-disaccharide synthase|nr:lipid-A-disaccharide synthase [Burkholderiaceae bacterium]
MTERIAFAAGEASGDLLASLVLPALHARLPGAAFAGIAGDRMAAAGCVPWFHVRELSVRGYAEVLRHLPRLLRLRHQFVARVQTWPAQLFVGVDAPDFNLGVAARLRAGGMKTVQYVSPAIWAWRPHRIEKIRRAVDRMLCIFPFEAALFARAGIDARYVGHPLARTIARTPDATAARARLGIATDAPTLALLPGSRQAEVASLGAPFLGAAAVLAQRDRRLQCVLPVADASLRPIVQAQCAAAGLDRARLHLIDGRSHDCLEAADVVLVAGGTATLEAMLFKRPMVIAYKVPALTEWITLRQAVIPYFGLPNVLEGRFTVPELLQEAVEPQRLAALVQRYFDRPQEVAELRERFERQHEALLRDTPALTAEAIADMLPAGAR